MTSKRQRDGETPAEERERLARWRRAVTFDPKRLLPEPTMAELVARLDAARAARLADPNTPLPVKQRILETQRQEEAQQREEAQQPKPTRKRKPTVASVIRQMKRAGVEVAGCEINPRDGTVKVISGKPVGGSDIDFNDTTNPDPKWN